MIPAPDAAFPNVSLLYDRYPFQFPLIRAVLLGLQPGSVLVDKLPSPSQALVVTRFGFTQTFGDDELVEQIVDLLFENPALRGRYLLWYAPPAGCQKRLQMLDIERVRQRQRIQFSLKADQFRLRKPHSKLPEGARVLKLDSENLHRTQPFKVDIIGRFWAVKEDFLNHGFGFGVEIEGKLASICYSACVARGVAEIDVATVNDYRGMGLGRAAAEAFVEHCFANRIKPNWDCFDDNVPSLRLARRLGFRQTYRYPFYSLNT